MGIEDRNWWKDKQNDAERKKLANSSFWCKYCEGLTVNTLTLICNACGRDNSHFYRNINPVDGHPPTCTCAECTTKRLHKT